MEKAATTPDQHIASLPPDVRADIAELDRVISEEMPGASRTLWEGRFWGGSDQKIIGYGDYTYQQANKKTADWFIVGLAVQKGHLSLYVNAADENGYLVSRYADRLGKVKLGSAAITFKSASDLEMTSLRELIASAYQTSSGGTSI
ncbi:MAG: DUF1801 domain-containing protein [Actinomycetota bacterium]|nr:DUF1801 domain-containing protein [Actinomycetota bacterium]